MKKTISAFFMVYMFAFSNIERSFAVKIFSVLPMDELTTVKPGGNMKIPRNTRVKIKAIGEEFTEDNGLYLTTNVENCSMSRRTDTYWPKLIDHNNNTAVYNLIIEAPVNPDVFWCICLIVDNYGRYAFEHQGDHEWLRFIVADTEKKQLLLPLWLQISICCILLILSGLFSGLNLGLMSLDQTELKIIEKVGSPAEKKHAKRIGPLRRRGNLLLCALLLGNVLVNSTFTILFDNMTNGLIAVVSSTLGIVIFGEIIPQAICSRHGLAVGAKTYCITVFFIIITLPVSFPISLILDFILGEEMGQAFNKEKLQELIRMTADKRIIHDSEANIISGALQLTTKCVEDVMTKIEDVYMLDISTVLDFNTISEIMHHGYTRIPVYDGEKTNIVNLLNMKELALIDPDDKTLVSTVCKFYDHRPLFVDHDVKLDAMLQAFLQAGSSHMAIVQRLHNTGDEDPYFENLGVITLEDVIEEILQNEIVDETDLKVDNRQKTSIRQKEDYDLLVPNSRTSTLPKQLAFAAFQFLTTTVEPFSDVHLARNVLKTLMKKDIVVTITPTEHPSPKNCIFQKGVPSDKFVLILQGSVEVEIGDESMVFETGPFSYFGVECINRSRVVLLHTDPKTIVYIPDFSVRALTDVQYLCISRNMYIAALNTTRMLRQCGSIAVGDTFEEEYEKVRKSNENHSSSDGFSVSYSPFLGANLDIMKIGVPKQQLLTSFVDPKHTWLTSSVDPEQTWQTSSVDPEQTWLTSSVHRKQTWLTSSVDPKQTRLTSSVNSPVFFQQKFHSFEELSHKLQTYFDDGEVKKHQIEVDILLAENNVHADLNTSRENNDRVPQILAADSIPVLECFLQSSHLDTFEDLSYIKKGVINKVTVDDDLEHLELDIPTKVSNKFDGSESTARSDTLINPNTEKELLRRS